MSIFLAVIKLVDYSIWCKTWKCKSGIRRISIYSTRFSSKTYSGGKSISTFHSVVWHNTIVRCVSNTGTHW